MQLTFGNMTMEVNIFNLVKKPNLYEDDPMDVFLIDSVGEEHVDCLMGHDLDSYYECLDEGNNLFEPPKVCYVETYLSLVSTLRLTSPTKSLRFICFLGWFSFYCIYLN